jgi:hypothetical protein
MAITPRTILTSAAPATVAVVSLYLFTAIGVSAFKCTKQATAPVERSYSQIETMPTIQVNRVGACNDVINVLGVDKQSWSETGWVMYVSCFDQCNDSRMVISAASHGLRYYPSSEVLYNLVGYHQIVLGEHEAAVHTLQTGMRNVARQQIGTMANNLSWASLWVPRSMRLEESRALYRQSLAIAPNSCETLHTGLWVEYAMSKRANGVEQFEALRAFGNLRDRYEPCLQRAENGDWNTLIEVVGAAVMFEYLDFAADRSQRASDVHHPTLVNVTKQFRANYRGASIDAICKEAMPLSETHHLCVDRVDTTAKHLRALETRTNQQRAVKEVPCGLRYR